MSLKINDRVVFKKDSPNEYPKKKVFRIDCFVSWKGSMKAMLKEEGDRFISIRFVDKGYIKVLKKRRKRK